MQLRRFEILIGTTLPELPQNALLIGGSGFPFSNAANLLGQEFKNIVIDSRTGIHLESLAIAAGTLQAGGLLLLVLSDWENLSQLLDTDSLRWSGKNQPIATPNFVAHFKRCVAQFCIKILHGKSAVDFAKNSLKSTALFAPTREQSEILQGILQRKHTRYFLTAKRGRGKSALLGMLAERLQDEGETVYLCAPNQRAVAILKNFCPTNIAFIAPDELAQRLNCEPTWGNKAWLLVDEAAMIPLSLWQQIEPHFAYIIFSTTTQSYEGTGRGFGLKFQNFCQSHRAFTLQKPLRWREDDLIEPFIEQLLLLNAENAFFSNELFGEKEPLPNIAIQPISQQVLADDPQAFYGLLCAAHYRTAPLDLRRLFDAPKQHFWQAQYQQNLFGALWIVEEGNMRDEALISAIQRGERRPRGNLAAQTLALYYQQSSACELSSWRISRIAVAPNWQKRGLGKKLIAELIKSAVGFGKDFLSVSFGYTEDLARFWQDCGFVLVHFSQGKEASSGCYSALALRGISEKGAALVGNIAYEFRRGSPLSHHPLVATLSRNCAIDELNWQLNEQDWQLLHQFAHYHLPLTAALPSLRRWVSVCSEPLSLLQDLCQQKQNIAEFGGQREWLKACREAVKYTLQHHIQRIGGGLK